MNYKERQLWIDCLRGGIILLVVMGHIVQYNQAFNHRIYDFIYSFHMPLFFAISGVTAKLSLSKMNEMTFLKLVKSIRHKFIRIELPNLFWGLVIPMLLLNDWCIRNAVYTVNPYWFLSMLFEIFVFHHFIIFSYQHLHSSPHFKIIKILAFICIMSLVLFAFYKNFALLRILYYGAFYLGFFIDDIYKYTSWIEKLARMGLPAIMFLFFACRFRFDAREAGYTMSALWLEYTASFFAIWTAFHLFRTLGNSGGYIYKSFVMFGQSSLAIYVTHYGFVYANWKYLCFSTEIQWVVLFVWGISVCFICSGLRLLLKRIPGMSLLLFGE